MNKKVLIVAATLAGGGAERVFVNLANKMIEKGIEVHILITADKPADYQADNRIKLIRIETGYRNKLIKIARKLKQIRKIFKEHDGYTLIAYMPDVCAYTAAASVGLHNKVIMSERSAPMCNPDQSYMRKIRNFAYRFADICVFQTEGAKDYFDRKIRKRSAVILNPISENLPAVYTETREKTIIVIGRLVPSKNLFMIIEAFQKLQKDYPEYVVKLYGRGRDEEKLRKKVKDEGLEDSILFMGYSQDIYQELRKASVYVSSSDYEGLSNTMLEALALGVPTVVTDCPSGGGRMVIESGKNGILVPVGNSAALCEGIKKMLEDEVLCRRIADNAADVRCLCDIDKIVQEWMELL